MGGGSLTKVIESAQGGPRNLPLKFGQIGSITAEIMLTLSLCSSGYPKSFSYQTNFGDVRLR